MRKAALVVVAMFAFAADADKPWTNRREDESLWQRAWLALPGDAKSRTEGADKFVKDFKVRFRKEVP